MGTSEPAGFRHFKIEPLHKTFGAKVTGLRPLVKIHPETNRPSLAVGRHAYGIPGMSEEQSAKLLADLIEFAVSDAKRVYQHRWTVGDVLVWDNRCLMHRACSWNYQEPRVMLHSRIAGDPRSESAGEGRKGSLQPEARSAILPD
jgi:alpha-ketoglutarate-dependent taurine dioxygenase